MWPCRQWERFKHFKVCVYVWAGLCSRQVCDRCWGGMVLSYQSPLFLVGGPAIHTADLL